MSLLLEGLPARTIIRIVSPGGEVVGFGRVGEYDRIGLPVWGDDPETEADEGLNENQVFRVQRELDGNWVTADVVWLLGDNRYEPNGLAVGRIIDDSPPPGKTTVAVVPNPFNDRASIRYVLDHIGYGIISIYDLSGRMVEQHTIIETSSNTAGVMPLNTNHLPAGVLLLKLSAANSERVIKIVHIP